MAIAVILFLSAAAAGGYNVRMPEHQPPPPQREVHMVPHPTLRVYVMRCLPPEADALSDWLDSTLGRDYFMKRRHLLSILERDTNGVWAMLVAEGDAGPEPIIRGLVIVYQHGVLHNFYVAPELRHTGVGSAVLQFFRPRRIRSKTNMLAGDPTDFYVRNGYQVDQPDPTRPHILDMVLPHGSPTTATGGTDSAHVNGVATPSTNGRVTSAAAAESGCTDEDRGPPDTAAQLPAPPAIDRACGVVDKSASSDAQRSHGRNATPDGSPVLDNDGFVTLTLEQYNELATLKKNRQRIAAYRAKRKAEKLQARK